MNGSFQGPQLQKKVSRVVFWPPIGGEAVFAQFNKALLGPSFPKVNVGVPLRKNGQKPHSRWECWGGTDGTTVVWSVGSGL